MKRTCSECGLAFNGLVVLYEHKLKDHPEWRRKIARVLDTQIRSLQEVKA